MSIYKIIPPNIKDYEELSGIIKFSSVDYYSSKSKFDDKTNGIFKDVDFKELQKPGEVLVHLVALGCVEYYGPNRWGDGFNMRVCRQYVPTFEKYAKFYRHHKNRDPKISYGVVKKAAFNDKMGRIELIVALNATKEAAERNNGLVADSELNKLNSNEPIPVSMSCLAEADVCSGCGHRAKLEKYYCTPAICKYGGLSVNKGKTFEDGHILYADTQAPLFFDISHVRVPADRIAYVLGTIKAAEYLKESSKCPDIAYYYAAKEKDIYGILDKRLETIQKLSHLEKNPDKFVALFYNLFNFPEAVKKYEKEILKTAGFGETIRYNIIFPLDVFAEKLNLDSKKINLKKVANGVYSCICKVSPIYDILIKKNFDDLNDTYNNKLNEKIILYNLSQDLLEKKALFVEENTDFGKIEYDTSSFNEDEKELAVLYGIYQLELMEKGKFPPALIVAFNKSQLKE